MNEIRQSFQNARAIIDPTCRILYSSFYIKGLYDVLGKKNISFELKYFDKLKRKEESHSYDHYMAFVIVWPDSTIKKYVIDFRDKPSIKNSAYEWCDIYAKVNFNKAMTNDKYHEKIASIPPGFGIRIWNPFETARYCLLNLIKCERSRIVDLKSFILDYYHQLKRPRLKTYLRDSVKKTGSSYVFMIGSLWTHKNCIEGTNLLRKHFIESCKSFGCNFEGGFYAEKEHPQYSEFEQLIFKHRYSPKRYVEKSKLSAFVFNTPAVHNCHGWKLGEYLAMGKAIITTPHSNELPENLVHGKNTHTITNAEELRSAIELLIKDNSYRKLLEEGAREYYFKLADPRAIIERLVGIEHLTESEEPLITRRI